MLRIITSIFLLLPFWSSAQYKGVSYELRNEIGTFKLTSLAVSHLIDNQEGITWVTDKTGNDTLYQIDLFLNGFVGLSNDGKTIVHLQSERNSVALDKPIITFYKDGKRLESAYAETQLLKYELEDAMRKNELPTSGWLRNDSLYHTMASNSFYITDDKVFISIDGPLLQVLDLNKMFLVYNGNGANHFMQNYYSIPNLPYRTEFTSSEYFPKQIPAPNNGRDFAAIVSNAIKLQVAVPEEAIYRVELDVLIRKDGSSEIRKTKIFSIKTNLVDEKLSESLKAQLPALTFQTSTIPPNHPAWVFSQNYWLK